MRTWTSTILILFFSLQISVSANAGEVPLLMNGKGVTAGSYNKLQVEGWSYFNSRGTMTTNGVIDLEFTITHETVRPDSFAGIIVIKGRLLRYGTSETGTFETTSCTVTSGYNMCSLFETGLSPRPIETHGDVGMVFVLQNDKPYSRTIFILSAGDCLSCPLLPIPTPAGEEKKYSKRKCFKTNPLRCPEDSDSYFKR